MNFLNNIKKQGTEVLTKITVPHTFAVAGEIKVAAGDTDFIPPFFVPVPAGQTVKVVEVRARLNGGTNAVVKLQKNGTDLTGFTGITVSPTAASTAPASQTLADNDMIALVVVSVSGTPVNMSFTLYLEYTV